MQPWVLLAFSLMTVPLVPLTAAEDLPVNACGLATNTPLVKFEVQEDCTVDAYVLYDMACLWNQNSKTFGVGPVRVTYYYCESGTDSTNAAACPGVTVNLLVEGSRLELYNDCTFTLYVTPDITCVGPWIGHLERTVGPATVDVTYCRPPFDGGA